MLLVKLLRWLLGYVSFSVTGSNGQRFFSAATQQRYILWNIQQETADCGTACIRMRQYRKLRPLARKRRVRLRILKKHGFPVWMHRWNPGRMACAAAGILCGILFLIFCSGRIWVVQVSGTTSVSDAAIQSAAKEAGLSVGAPKGSYQAASVESYLQQKFPEITWVSVNDWGNTVTIVVWEGTEAPKVEEEQEPTNLVASCAGRIVQMEVYEGESCVQVGDGVVPGQLLVSGVWESAKGTTRFLHSNAKIMAETQHTFQITFPRTEQQFVPTGRTRERRSLQLFGITIPLTISGTPDGVWTSEIRTDSWLVNQMELPVSFTTEVLTEQTERQYVRLKAIALLEGIAKIRQKQEEILSSDSENGLVLQETITMTETEEGYCISCQCICLENIAVSQPILLDFEQNDENSSSEP